MDQRAASRLRAWTLISGRHGRPAVQIPQRLSDSFAYDHNDEDWFIWSYRIVRSNLASLENAMFGKRPSLEDQNFVQLLSYLNKVSEQDGRRRVVLFLLEGLNAWSFTEDCWTTLSSKFPHLNLRVTIAELTLPVRSIPVAFRIRGALDAHHSIAWSHLEVQVVADIIKKLKNDRQHVIQWQRADSFRSYSPKMKPDQRRVSTSHRRWRQYQTTSRLAHHAHRIRQYPLGN